MNLKKKKPMKKIQLKGFNTSLGLITVYTEIDPTQSTEFLKAIQWDKKRKEKQNK